MSNKTYTIYTKRIVYLLREQGFKIIKLGVNENYPQFDTYIFENSPEFQSALYKLKKTKKS